MKTRIIVDQRITIAATADTVFRFACDYRNDPDWRSGVREMSTNSQGDTHAGDQSVFTCHAEALLDPRLRFFARPIERFVNRRAARDLRKLAEILTTPGTDARPNHPIDATTSGDQ